MDNTKNDEYYAKLIKEDIEKIIMYIGKKTYDEFIEDEKLVDAILFRLIQMTENIKKLSVEFKEKYNNIKWNNIIGFRNKIVHDYGKTDYTIVFEVAKNDIIILKNILDESK